MPHKNLHRLCYGMMMVLITCGGKTNAVGLNDLSVGRVERYKKSSKNDLYLIYLKDVQKENALIMNALCDVLL